VQECIHGLEIPLCDSCFPKAVIEKPKVARASSRSPRVSPASTSRKSLNTAAQRVYHVTHISNLESILATGALLADASPAVNVSTELTRELRTTAPVSSGGPMVADFVCFYLTPSATLWEQLREGAEDETRWSTAARTATSADFVFLVSTVEALGDGSIIADGDAAHSLTRFATGDSLTRMLERLHDSDDVQEAEALAVGPFPFESVQLIGVSNDRVRDRVKKLTATKVAVYPPWFQAAE
jgi:ssDNA thymidine ADP-ribosyltransferase, DarT